MKNYLFAIILSIGLNAVKAQSTTGINPALLKGEWPANWITCPGVPQRFNAEGGSQNFRFATRATESDLSDYVTPGLGYRQAPQ